MAEALGESPSTVQSWKAAGRVPSTKQPDVLARGAELKIGIGPVDVVFPLIRRPDANPADRSSVPLPADDTFGSVAACAPVASCDRGTVLHRRVAR